MAGFIFTLFEMQNILSLKNIKTQRRLGRCRILNALTLENLRVRIQNRVLLLGFVPFLLYRTHALLL